jgi:hypothetical protein
MQRQDIDGLKPISWIRFYKFDAYGIGCLSTKYWREFLSRFPGVLSDPVLNGAPKLLDRNGLFIDGPNRVLAFILAQDG